jgi:hypothetical protein
MPKGLTLVHYIEAGKAREAAINSKAASIVQVKHQQGVYLGLCG